MSFSLYWRPAAPPPPDHHLDPQLKYKISPKLWDHDGTLRGEPYQLSKDHPRTMGYLEGMADAGIAGAQELIDAINEHGTVEIFIGDQGDY
jgi:hypothetical protein